jgi:hypothetical protein
MSSLRLYPTLSSGEEYAAPVRWKDVDQNFEVHDGEETIPIPKTEN